MSNDHVLNAQVPEANREVTENAAKSDGGVVECSQKLSWRGC